MCENCETCIKLKRNPERQFVRLPTEKVFNIVVPLDVRELEGEKCLVMGDLATRYRHGDIESFCRPVVGGSIDTKENNDR